MELVRRDVHCALSHKGPAAVLRATARSTTQGGSTQRRGIGGTTARAVGIAGCVPDGSRSVAMSVCLVPNIIPMKASRTNSKMRKMGRNSLSNQDGYVCKKGICFRTSQGQSEPITDEEVENYKKAAEEEFGKYVPGKSPRFIPGQDAAISMFLITMSEACGVRLGPSTKTESIYTPSLESKHEYHYICL